MAKQTVGRPTKYTIELAEAICRDITACLPKESAAYKNGIHPDTFYTWVNEKSEFSDMIKKAEAQCEAQLIADIRNGIKEWTSRAWLCERKWRDKYHLKQQIEHSGEMKFKLDLPNEIDESKL